MFKRGSIQSHLNLKDKILAMDFVLLSCIIILSTFFNWIIELKTQIAHQSIILKDFLNQFSIAGFKLGFWFAQQGSIYVFVILIFTYVRLMNNLDKKFGFKKYINIADVDKINVSFNPRLIEVSNFSCSGSK